MNCKQRPVCSRYARTRRQEYIRTCIRYIYVSNSTGAIIRVKLIRHLRNGDCGTNEVHVKPIIRLEFPAAKYARRVSGEITRAAGDCLRFDLPASPTVCQGGRRRIRRSGRGGSLSVTRHRIIRQGTAAESPGGPC